MGWPRSFVIVAEMRTGSNFLESALNALDGVSCHGELFNRNFIGYPGRHEAFGIDETTREADPGSLLRAMRDSGPGLHGFRWFPDHDRRVLPLVLADPAVAIVRLNRNAAEVWVSRQIARATGQWRLGDLKNRRAATVTFDREDFTEYLHVRDAFDHDFRHRLQSAGRTAFQIDYADLTSLEVLNGLASWLGVPARLDTIPNDFRKQNPGELSDKVDNPGEMAEVLRDLRVSEGGGESNLRPAGAGVPGWYLAARAPILFQPIPGGPVSSVRAWLETLDGAPPALGARQKDLRTWQEAHPGNRAVTVLRHPLLRAVAALGEVRSGGLARSLARYGVDTGADPTAEMLVAWLEVIGGALAGQTSFPPERSWRPQSELVAAAAAVRPPDLVLREEEVETALPGLGGGLPVPTDPEARRLRETLERIVSPRAEQLANRVYRSDFRTFGFADWRSGGG